MNTQNSPQRPPNQPTAVQASHEPNPAARADLPGTNEVAEKLLFRLRFEIAGADDPQQIIAGLEAIESGQTPKVDDSQKRVKEAIANELITRLKLAHDRVRPYVAALDRKDITLPELVSIHNAIAKYMKRRQKLYIAAGKLYE